MFPYQNIDEKKIIHHISEVTESEVRATLSKESHTLRDLLNLVAPVASTYIEEMRQKARKARLAHFGNSVSLYSPLYVSSSCINACTYCGFRSTNKTSTRKALTIDEAIQDAKIIKGYGIDSILIVSGEDYNGTPPNYLEELIIELKKMFSHVAIEVYPMGESDYRKLFKAGAHGLTLYQETYIKENYKKFHLSGPKKDYENRLKKLESGAKAGFYTIGIGALLGLYDWKIESAFLGAHAAWLKKHYWKSKIQFSFPRITPIEGGFEPPSPINENELEQMVLAFRIVFPTSEISISTRESKEFRNQLAYSCANRLSAASRVIPGSYSEEEKKLGQFSLRDSRSSDDTVKDLQKLSLEPVFKDWDTCLGV